MRAVSFAIAWLLCGVVGAQPLPKDTSGIKTLTLARAEVLAERPGPLAIDGVTTLTSEIAQALVARERDLSLDGLKSLPPELAAVLANHRGGLSLDGLATVSDDAAVSLAKHRGDLSLNGLRELSSPAAEALSRHDAELSMNGLPEISSSAAKALARRKHRTSLAEVRVLSSEASQALRANPLVDLPPERIEPPALRRLLSGREGDRKVALVRRDGGSDVTEAAVSLALEWLVRQQGKKDGLWSLKGPYLDGAPEENRLAATAMALLALQGAGNTPDAGPHLAAVAKAWRSLLARQQSDGSFDVGRVPLLQGLYAHAQVTIAVCEVYGMTRDEKFAEPAARAVAYALKAQGGNGGWKYEPGQNGDMSVTGWYMLALKTAEMAGLDVPPDVFARIDRFVDAVAVDGGRRYAYMPSTKVAQSKVSAAVSAEGLLCRQFLGWPQNDPRLVEGVTFLLGENPLDFENGKDVYAWYYITQVVHHMGGEPWKGWNERLREVLPSEQVDEGRERGSWDPALDHWGHVGGRLFMTTFCTLMLEAYYRHLPLYDGQ